MVEPLCWVGDSPSNLVSTLFSEEPSSHICFPYEYECNPQIALYLVIHVIGYRWFAVVNISIFARHVANCTVTTCFGVPHMYKTDCHHNTVQVLFIWIKLHPPQSTWLCLLNTFYRNAYDLWYMMLIYHSPYLYVFAHCPKKYSSKIGLEPFRFSGDKIQKLFPNP